MNPQYKLQHIGSLEAERLNDMAYDLDIASFRTAQPEGMVVATEILRDAALKVSRAVGDLSRGEGRNSDE
jgi:hypothetical protein